MLSCNSFKLRIRITSSRVSGLRKMKSPKPMCSSSRWRRSTLIFFEFLSTKWKPSASAFSRFSLSELSIIKGRYSSSFLMARSSFKPASESFSATGMFPSVAEEPLSSTLLIGNLTSEITPKQLSL